MYSEKDFLVGLYNLDEKATFSKLKSGYKGDLATSDMDKFFSYCKKNNIQFLLGNEVFLKKVTNPPFILSFLGNLDLLNYKIIGIVGPRKITSFIQAALDRFFEKIKSVQNIAIVSGLADGTDKYAHGLAMKYNIPTISVLGYGLAKGLTGSDKDWIKSIVDKGGLVLSEFRLKQAGTNWTFPQRNRIIAGLSDILFVPQAEEKSGSLITVDFALRYGIDVYACFSAYDDEMGKGTNKLIAQDKINGVYDFNDFISFLSKKLNFGFKNEKKPDLNLTEGEKIVLQEIKKGNDSLDLLAMSTMWDFSKLMEVLSKLELQGLIKFDVDKILIQS